MCGRASAFLPAAFPPWSYRFPVHLFLIVWSCIVGTAAVGTLVLSAAIYARVRRPKPADGETIG